MTQRLSSCNFNKICLWNTNVPDNGRIKRRWLRSQGQTDTSGHRDRQIPQVTGTDRYLRSQGQTDTSMPVQRSCYKECLWARIIILLMNNIYFSFKFVKWLCLKVYKQQNDHTTRNIHVTYENCGTHCWKVLIKVKVNKKKAKLQGQGHRVKYVDNHEKILSQGMLM